MALDYKTKYNNLKASFLSSVNTSFKLGYEKGLSDSQTQQAQQQAADAQAQLQAIQNPQGQLDANGQPMDPNAPQDPNAQPAQLQKDPSAMGQEQPMDEGQGTELDGHLNELEGLVSKGQKPSLPDLRKKIEEITNLRKSQKESLPIKQVESPKKLLVKSILDGWKKEEVKSTSKLADIIADVEKNIK
jgi:hypothetical protein